MSMKGRSIDPVLDRLFLGSCGGKKKAAAPLSVLELGSQSTAHAAYITTRFNMTVLSHWQLTDIKDAMPALERDWHRLSYPSESHALSAPPKQLAFEDDVGLWTATMPTSTTASGPKNRKATRRNTTHVTEVQKIESSIITTHDPLQHPRRPYDIVFTANTLHVASWPACCTMFSRLPHVLSKQPVPVGNRACMGGRFVVYGPFRDPPHGLYDKIITAAQGRFHESLVPRFGPDAGLRSLEEVMHAVDGNGFRLESVDWLPEGNAVAVFCLSRIPDEAVQAE